MSQHSWVGAVVGKDDDLHIALLPLIGLSRTDGEWYWAWLGPLVAIQILSEVNRN